YGSSIAYDGSTLKTTSTKYTTAYPFDSTIDNTSIINNDTNLNTASANNYKKDTSIYGDGIQETSITGTGNTSWYGDYSYYTGLNNPFSLRGGYFWHGSGAGLFYFHRSPGGSGYGGGFRTVLAVS
ncbi:MAG: hypothetical protein ACLTEH_03520, partial [Clostridia bacterium]